MIKCFNLASLPLEVHIVRLLELEKSIKITLMKLSKNMQTIKSKFSRRNEYFYTSVNIKELQDLKFACQSFKVVVGIHLATFALRSTT